MKSAASVKNEEERDEWRTKEMRWLNKVRLRSSLGSIWFTDWSGKLLVLWYFSKQGLNGSWQIQYCLKPCLRFTSSALRREVPKNTHQTLKWSGSITPHLITSSSIRMTFFMAFFPAQGQPEGSLASLVFPHTENVWWPCCTLPHHASWRIFPAYS